MKNQNARAIRRPNRGGEKAATVKAGGNFFNLYNHDFVRATVGIPAVRVADPAFNGEQMLAQMYQAVERKVLVLLFPELGLSAYSCDDLFHQSAVLDGCLDALGNLIATSARWPLVTAVGMPLRVDHMLYNCPVAFTHGPVRGVIPKADLPTYRQFYELTQFNPPA